MVHRTFWKLVSEAGVQACNARNGRGQTPLLLAVAQGHGPLAEALVIGGAGAPIRCRRSRLRASVASAVLRLQCCTLGDSLLFRDGRGQERAVGGARPTGGMADGAGRGRALPRSRCRVSGAVPPRPGRAAPQGYSTLQYSTVQYCNRRRPVPDPPGRLGFVAGVAAGPW